MGLAGLHPPKQYNELFFQHLLAGMDLLAHGVECRLVHALGLRPDPISHAEFDAEFPAKVPCPPASSIMHPFAPGHVGKVMAFSAQKQASGAVQVLAPLSAMRAQEERGLASLVTVLER